MTEIKAFPRRNSRNLLACSLTVLPWICFKSRDIHVSQTSCEIMAKGNLKSYQQLLLKLRVIKKYPYLS